MRQSNSAQSQPHFLHKLAPHRFVLELDLHDGKLWLSRILHCPDELPDLQILIGAVEGAALRNILQEFSTVGDAFVGHSHV
jgi:hypothetical protein